MLNRFNMSNCKSAVTSLEPHVKLNKEETDQNLSQDLAFPYQEAVGSILYLSQTTSPDVLCIQQ